VASANCTEEIVDESAILVAPGVLKVELLQAWMRAEVGEECSIDSPVPWHVQPRQEDFRARQSLEQAQNLGVGGFREEHFINDVVLEPLARDFDVERDEGTQMLVNAATGGRTEVVQELEYIIKLLELRTGTAAIRKFTSGPQHHQFAHRSLQIRGTSICRLLIPCAQVAKSSSVFHSTDARSHDDHDLIDAMAHRRPRRPFHAAHASCFAWSQIRAEHTIG
jgi:hypothetical protein